VLAESQNPQLLPPTVKKVRPQLFAHCEPHSDFAISRPAEADCVLQTPAQSSEGQTQTRLDQSRNYGFPLIQTRPKPPKTTRNLTQTQEQAHRYGLQTSPVMPYRMALSFATLSLLHPAYRTPFTCAPPAPRLTIDRPTAKTT
jgi:hypothetical protein